MDSRRQREGYGLPFMLCSPRPVTVFAPTMSGVPIPTVGVRFWFAQRRIGVQEGDDMTAPNGLSIRHIDLGRFGPYLKFGAEVQPSA
jgi:hypothetical protein